MDLHVFLILNPPHLPPHPIPPPSGLCRPPSPTHWTTSCLPFVRKFSSACNPTLCCFSAPKPWYLLGKRDSVHEVGFLLFISIGFICPLLREKRSIGLNTLEAHQSSQSESMPCRVSESHGLAHTDQIARQSSAQLEASLAAQTVKDLPAFRRPRFDPWVGEIPWRRAWQPTTVFLPGESHGQRSLVGHSPWGRKESDMTERIRAPCVRAHTHTHTCVHTRTHMCVHTHAHTHTHTHTQHI